MLHVESVGGQVLAAAAWADYGPSFYGPPVNDGNWHLVEIGFVPATNTFTLYVNGAAASSYTPGTTFTESTASFYIGHRVPAGADDFLGQIANVSVTHGTADALTGDTWYNPLNRVVKQAPEGAAKMYTKTAYDLANRVIGTYTGYAPTSDTNNFAVNSSDKIFEQTVLTLDAAGNTQLATFFQRNQGDTTVNGALTSSHARVSYMAFWQDGGERPIATANYGAAATAPTVPLPLPVSGPTVLVNGTAYNNRSEAYLFNDPSGMVVRTDTDDAGRPVRTIQNYVPGACSPHSCGMRRRFRLKPVLRAQVGVPPRGPPPRHDRPRRERHDAHGLHARRQRGQADRGQPGDGQSNDEISLRHDACHFRRRANDLLAAVLYPDAADSADSVQLQYNLQSEVAADAGPKRQLASISSATSCREFCPIKCRFSARAPTTRWCGSTRSTRFAAWSANRRVTAMSPGLTSSTRFRWPSANSSSRRAKRKTIIGHRRPGQRRRLWLQHGRHVQFDRAAFADLPGTARSCFTNTRRRTTFPWTARPRSSLHRGSVAVLRLFRPGELRLRHLRDLAGDQHHAGDRAVIPVSTSSAA